MVILGLSSWKWNKCSTSLSIHLFYTTVHIYIAVFYPYIFSQKLHLFSPTHISPLHVSLLHISPYTCLYTATVPSLYTALSSRQLLIFYISVSAHITFYTALHSFLYSSLSMALHSSLQSSLQNSVYIDLSTCTTLNPLTLDNYELHIQGPTHSNNIW